ncbi:phosphatidate cytidylyltransferase [Rickettsiales endosymbiont of Stachyamoeba lipophora]|uniref:phosphatidate cytidylyltransferase n=1 Tax=Rickettsiales endosymbiont of Stachyamoeba lipophora TaxID=2486578 RepID=UPI000F654310|nr:phosphatidate cytidylyltransferase [Rickettsiales endosymbiont of Stachyamoeba lipophora]AZL15080.1 hypothetical protein EF513_00685 [Rickettsiales endosymbiont of Stachyamoeba lipophora]
MNISNFITRFISAIILAPLALYVFYLGGMWFNAVVAIVAIIMAMEWKHIISSNGKPKNIWYLIGALVILAPTLSLIWIRIQEDGLKLIYLLFITVWMSDIGGYIFGKTLKGPKLAPKISPNKTWSGFFGGILLALLGGLCFGLFYNLNLTNLAIITSLLSVYSQISDLLESKIKRHFGVKDSGKIIPGHGGILDRIDGLILTAPKMVLLLYLTNGNLF